jgi:hypothetical protein
MNDTHLSIQYCQMQPEHKQLEQLLKLICLELYKRKIVQCFNYSTIKEHRFDLKEIDHDDSCTYSEAWFHQSELLYQIFQICLIKSQMVGICSINFLNIDITVYSSRCKLSAITFLLILKEYIFNIR